MIEIVSPTQPIQSPAQAIYFVFSNFRNFDQMPRGEGVNDWQTTENTIHFNYKKFLYIGMQIIEKEEFKLIKIASEGKNPFRYTIWLQLKEVAYNDTRLKITLRAEMNIFKRLLFKRFLQKFVNGFAEQIATMFKR